MITISAEGKFGPQNFSLQFVGFACGATDLPAAIGEGFRVGHVP